MEYFAGEVMGIYGAITAPIHELGHVIFGWLTLNPTSIAGWNLASASRDGFIMSLGGYLFEIIFGAALVWFLRRNWFAYPVGTVQIAAALYATSYQADFPEGSDQHLAAQIIWLIATVAAFVIMFMAFLKARQEKDAEFRRSAQRIQREIAYYRSKAVHCRPGSELQRHSHCLASGPVQKIQAHSHSQPGQ